jgi:hypothetical protein
MPDGSEQMTAEVVSSIERIAAADWDACAGTTDPFVGHAFLEALEASGSVTAETGWLPQHPVVRGADGTVLACAPLYLKSHSYGEYVFDWGWAEAYERAGGRYYPKLQAAVPFTPVTGRRLLVRPGAPAASADVLSAAMVALAKRHGVSSLHVTFPTGDDLEHFAALGLLVRTGYQFHWHNRDYDNFEAFLGDLASRKRKAIRRERREVADSGVVLRALSGSDLGERHWDAFYAFYRNTHDRKWGHAYLNRDFFLRLGDVLGDRVLLILAEDRSGRPVAGALNLIGGDALYGRYWGCADDFKFLHFETCYYQAIDFAIARGLARVEAGAQGPHKLQRGYLPVATHSAHWIADQAFRTAVERYLGAERVAMERDIAELAADSPFRRGAD